MRDASPRGMLLACKSVNPSDSSSMFKVKSRELVNKLLTEHENVRLDKNVSAQMQSVLKDAEKCIAR